jgi:histidine ammonia-lyase
VITLEGEPLSAADVAAVADGAPVVLGPAGRARVAAAHDLAVRLSAERTVYGRTTGVGANKDAAVTADAGPPHAERLLRSHATSAGPVRDARRVRATMAVRLNQLAAGGGGVRPEVADALAELLASGTVPPVREHGGVGTGDLGALATVALALPGVRWTADDALPFLSSNAATVADAALAVAGLGPLVRAGLAVAATTFAAVDGAPEAFSPTVEALTPYDGARAVCRALRELTAPGLGPAARLQDPFALRCLPQVHGLLLDTVDRLSAVVADGTASWAENPAVDVAAGTLAHHGAFHAAYLASALDTVLLALAGAAAQSLRRLSFLLDPAATGLPPFLGDGTAGASGAMGLEYAAASALGELRGLAAPASIQTVSLSRGVEDDASFASQGARQALDARSPLSVVLAAELVAAVRAVRLSGRAVPEQGWGAVVSACSALDADPKDRDVSGDLETAAELLPRLAQLPPSTGRSSSA